MGRHVAYATVTTVSVTPHAESSSTALGTRRERRHIVVCTWPYT